MNKFKAIRVLVNVMCNAGFMHGWFGDTDQDFRDEQAEYFLSLSPVEQREWIAGNRFNLTHYCRVPQRILELACS